jgi:nuclear pore complex protein Nup98-Nup96
MDERERAFHDSLKPSWDANGTLVYAAPTARKAFTQTSRDRDGLLVVQKSGIVSESRDVRFAKFSSEVSVLTQFLGDYRS